MNYRQIIGEAWAYTQANKRLIIWFGFLPSILTTTVGVFYIGYQFFALKNSYLFSNEEDDFLYDIVTFIFDFFKEHLQFTVPVIVVLSIFGILYFTFPTIAKASAMQKIARDRNGQDSGLGTGLKWGIRSFLPLFEYHLLIRTFTFFSILVEMSFVLRNLGPLIFKFLFPVFLIIMVIGLVLSVLFTYTDFYIVIDDLGVFESMKKSARLVTLNLKHTFLISILMLIIGVRIIIQAIMVFLIPAMVVVITGYIATVALPITGLIVGGITGFIALILASYLNGIVDVFSYAVWTFTFLTLSSEPEVSAREVFSDDIGEQSNMEIHHKNLE